jgi:hypothetical protein
MERVKTVLQSAWTWLMVGITGTILGLWLLVRLGFPARRTAQPVPPVPTSAGRKVSSRRILEASAAESRAEAEAAKAEIRAQDSAHVAAEWNRLRNEHGKREIP